MGDTEKCISVKNKSPSGNIGIIIVEKVRGKMNALAIIGKATSDGEIFAFVIRGHAWIDRETGKGISILNVCQRA